MTLDFLQTADGTARLFLILAFSGTLFFALRMVMALVAGFGDHDVGADAHVHDVHAPSDGHHGHGSDVAFQLISLNSITGFIMMFGWVGLAAYSDRRWSAVNATIAGLIGGFVTMVLTAHVFRMAMGLVNVGERFSTAKTVGSTATVYAEIPAEGRGQIQVTANGLKRTLDAVSEDHVPLASFSTVTVVKAIDERTVAVRKAAA